MEARCKHGVRIYSHHNFCVRCAYDGKAIAKDKKDKAVEVVDFIENKNKWRQYAHQ